LGIRRCVASPGIESGMFRCAGREDIGVQAR
jgi:hypothetical protein